MKHKRSAERSLLMLGGSDIQVTAIQRARELGYRVITCDNRPDNPGHAFSDAYHEVSTTDLEGVLALARDLGIHGISAYASDPAAVTAAYVAEVLGLPGDPYAAVLCVQDKVEFRRIQSALGLPCPVAMAVTDPAVIRPAVAGWRNGGVIKPVDTSGSKGIARIPRGVDGVEAERLFQEARSFSRAGRVILEEYLPRVGPQMTGDALVMNGRIVFWCFGDVHFNDRLNGLVPRGVTVPGTLAPGLVNDAIAGLQRLVDHLGLRQGVYNIDLIADEQDRPVVVDLGLRNGGNMLNTLYHRRTGVDLMEISLRLCMGEQVAVPKAREGQGTFVGHCVVHAEQEGVVKEVWMSPWLQRHIFHRSISVAPGSQVQAFSHSGHRLGLLLLEFGTAAEMSETYAHMHEHVRVIV
jgi:biotin carboxylase